MLMQIDLLVLRIILSVSVQIAYSIFGFILGIRVLRRRKSKISVSLALAFILVSFGYILLSFSSFVLLDPIPFIIYIISYTIVLFGNMLILIFTVNLRFRKNEPFGKWQVIYMVIFAVILDALLFIPNSITVDQSTNWVTVYSWEFCIASMIYYSISVFIPEIYFLFKLFQQTVEKSLKKKLKVFLIGASWFLFAPIPLFLYNAWVDNLVYRTVYSVISYFQVIPIVLVYFETKEMY